MGMSRMKPDRFIPGFWSSILILYFSALVSTTYFEALDDSILHKINWAGPMLEGTSLKEPQEEIVMTTAMKETYRCTLPRRRDSHDEDEGPYTGPDPFELLAPLFNQFVCTFKLETYWTYELCHGKYIRQYHEERDGKTTKLQEFFLGRWGKADSERTKIQFQKEQQESNSNQITSEVPMKRIDGVNMPYLQVNMSDGTLCDINGQARASRVLYVCYPQGKHEIYSLEEVSTCEYEIVVLSPLLCAHPDFKSKEAGENSISCYSLEESPKIPKALVELEAESFKIRHEHLLQNLESLLESKIKSTDSKPFELNLDNDQEESEIRKPSPHDTSFLENFLSGKSCLTGGSHWWKFEFCYGKHIIQYHEEPDGSRTEILLGKWSEERHKSFLDSNPHKKPQSSQQKRTVYHYYSGGDQCETTGLPRAVEVKLRCVDHPSPSSIGIYLLEPKACDYTLVVESSLFCSILKNADEYGMLNPSINDDIELLKPKKERRIKKIKASDDIEIIVMEQEGDEEE